MKFVEILHPSGCWVEVYRGSDESAIKSLLNRYVIEMGLRGRVMEESK